MKKILVVGGSGYIGTVICKNLTTNAKVYNLDNQIYNQDYIKYFSNSNYIEIKDDIRSSDINSFFHEIDILIILAGLVGDPITRKYPKESIEINEKSILKIIQQALLKNIPKIIFVSTCSNYGKLNKNQIADETTPLNPLSSYSKSKVKIENFLINSFNNHSSITILRFATAFGLSPRMRYDLTINEFVREAFFKKYLEIYDPETNRPYCHVNDFAKIISLIVEEQDLAKVNGQIFNAGSDINNSSKINLVKIIKKFIPDLNYTIVKNDLDKRDYIVSFKKINNLFSFSPEYNIEDGVIEILNFLKEGNHKLNQNKEIFGNYKLLK